MEGQEDETWDRHVAAGTCSVGRDSGLAGSGGDLEGMANQPLFFLGGSTRRGSFLARHGEVLPVPVPPAPLPSPILPAGHRGARAALSPDPWLRARGGPQIRLLTVTTGAWAAAVVTGVGVSVGRAPHVVPCPQGRAVCLPALTAAQDVLCLWEERGYFQKCDLHH